jgi:hypothetical protein
MAIINQIGGISTGSLTGVLKGPLEKLFGKKPGANMYQYPADLGNDPSRMHIVQFTISEVLPSKFVTQIENSAEGIAIDTASGAYNVAAGAAKGVGSLFGSGNAEAAKAQAQKGAGELSSATLKVTDLATNLNAYLQTEKIETKTSISLYMPDTLSMNYHAEYSDLTLMDATNSMNRVAGAIGSIVEDLLAGKGNTDEIKNTITNNLKEYGPEGALRLADRQFNTNLTDLGLQALGKAINPQLQLIYKGVGFRTFTMEFLFTPKSKEESDQVSAIVNTFIYASSPRIQGKGGMYFTPPSVFTMKFLMAKSGGISGLTNMLQKAGNSIIPNIPLGNAITGKGGAATGIENDRLYKVGQCVLEDVSVDYAPNGWAAYSGGAPVQTRLNLSFKEIEILDRTRMEKGDVR